MASVSRRVSYILPAPNEPPPLLSLPALGERRRGQTAPYLVPKSETQNGFRSKNPFLSPEEAAPERSGHPRHSLGITSLALDTSTLLSNTQSPGGILYSGGRDGLVASWELGVPHRRRRGGKYEILPGRGGGRKVRWERIGDGAEMWDDEDEEDFDDEEDEFSTEEEISDDWVGANVDRVMEGLSRRKTARGEVPYEDRWEVDKEQLLHTKPLATKFRQSAQTHTDWVNAILLCNLNQTVITGSADRTIRAWTPHASADSAGSPALIGRHRDYVRSLAWAKYPSLLFSGALDRQLSIWDVQSPTPDTPLLNIDLNKADEWGGVGMEGERGSVYALGVDPAGRVLAAGTPERVVRLWDPRVGDKSVGKLIGHSDCVRSIIVSEDGRYMLTGSSDTTVKLWSLGEHRCLHTFNHHTSSVWALHSNHPNLERFYSGSRDGHLCVVDVEQCTDISDGECVVLAREGDGPKNGEYESKTGDEGIRCIVGMDDEYVWTATGSADIKRWKDVGRRVDRLEKEVDGASYGNGDISIPVPSGPTTAPSAIANKAFSPDGGDGMERTDSGQGRSVAFAPPPLRNGHDANGSPSQRRKSADATSAGQTTTLNGLPYSSLVCLGLPDSPYTFGFSPRQDDLHTVRSGGSISSMNRNNFLKPDDEEPPRGSMQIDRPPATLARMEFEDREIASEAKPLRAKADAVIAGRSGLVRSTILNDRQHVLTVDTEGEVAVWNIIRGVCVGRFSSAEVADALHLERGVKPETAVRKHSNEVLELVKERVEGETMVITWCAVDTKIGSLVVSLEEGRVFDAEVYADELGLEALDGIREDTRINLGKWALANLFKGLIKAEEAEVTAMTPSTVASSLPSLGRSPAPSHAPLERSNAPLPHRARAMSGSLSIHSAPSLNIPGLATPAAIPAVLPDIESPLSKSAPTASAFQSFQAKRNAPLQAIPQSPSSAAVSPAMESHAGRGDYFSQKRKPDVSPSRNDEKMLPPATPGGTQVPQTPGGSFMGKLKLGLGKKKTAEVPMSTVVESTEAPVVDDGPKLSEKEMAQMAILDAVRAHPFHPPPPWEAPPLNFPKSTSLLISEESKDAGAWVVTYRSQVSSTERDMEPLEMNSPGWLLEYLFTTRTKIKDPVKLTFILEPANGSPLRPMPEGTTRLSASRVLRAKKIMAFIFDKLELGPSRGRAGSVTATTSRITGPGGRRISNAIAANNTPNASSPSLSVPDDFQPEDIIEVLCGDHVVDPRMTLATLKQYYGAGGDMLLNYRLKAGINLN